MDLMDLHPVPLPQRCERSKDTVALPCLRSEGTIPGVACEWRHTELVGVLLIMMAARCTRVEIYLAEMAPLDSAMVDLKKWY